MLTLQTAPETHVARDPSLRSQYAALALESIPRLLTAIDRNPCRSTYGCLDRQYWHYRTSSFASEMYQEGVLPLALVWRHNLPGNRWHAHPRVRELAIAALEYCARSARRDGSCDDYYPFERALGAAVFSFQAAAQACQVLKLDSPQVISWLRRRAKWVIEHGESGRLANHHALAALGLARLAQLTGDDEFRAASESRVRQVLAWQSSEGWFEEYGGADLGYQTVTIDCLAKLRVLLDDSRLEEPLRRAVRFARTFLHPDGTYAGSYGSRGTHHFYPHGFELLAGDNAEAADLADAFLLTLARRNFATFDDDRMVAHRLAGLIEAYLDWSPKRPVRAPQELPATAWFPEARLLVHRSLNSCTVVSPARGGAVNHFASSDQRQADCGLVLEMADGRVAVSQLQSMDRQIEFERRPDGGMRLTVTGPLHWVRFETMSPVKQALFHLGMWSIGRWCREGVRKLLQRRLITARRTCPITLKRTIELLSDDPDQESHSCRIIDELEIHSPRLVVRQLFVAADLEAAYVAASNVYHAGALEAWTDLSEHAAELNRSRRLCIEREQ